MRNSKYLAMLPRRRRAPGLGRRLARRRHLHDRRLQHRAGQWLARGNDLRDQGAGAGLRQGRQAQHRAPQHRRRRPARGHPQPDQRQVDAIVVNPADPAGIKAALEEATKAGIVVVAVDQTVTEPTAYIISNNQEQYAYLGAKWLFETDGRQGQRRLHARRGRRIRRQRPRQGLQEGAGRIPGRQGRAGGLHRLAAGPGQAADPRLHRHRRCPSTASGPRASTT